MNKVNDNEELKTEPNQEREKQERAGIYIKSVGAELRQGEIITDVSQYIYDPIAEDALEIRHDYAIIASQDCDLLREYENSNKPILNGVLIYEAQPVDIAISAAGGSDIWKRRAQNNDDRFHVLQEIPGDDDLQGKGLPALVIDFRRYFTLPPRELYRQCSIEGSNGAKRRTCLEPPYREHLQSRMAFYLQRVGLPAPHSVPTRATVFPPKQ